MDIKEINCFLQNNAETKFAEFSAPLIPGAKVLGVRLPVLRKFAAKLAKENWQDFFLNGPEEYTEHIMLKGFLLSHIKDIDLLLKYLKLYIPKIDNWAVCDSPLSSLKLVKKHRPLLWEFIQPYIKDKREFYARSAACLLMYFFIEEEYIDLVLKSLENIKAEGYYSRMGVAWALSICYIKFPGKTEELLKRQTLDIFTHNKTISKIKDSFRVSNADKARLDSLKRKQRSF